jgi:hypothetical protein
MGVQWDSVRATHGVSAEVYVWKTGLGRGRMQTGFFYHVMNYCQSWCLPGMHVSCWQVYTLAWLTIDLNLCDILGYG